MVYKIKEFGSGAGRDDTVKNMISWLNRYKPKNPQITILPLNKGALEVFIIIVYEVKNVIKG